MRGEREMGWKTSHDGIDGGLHLRLLSLQLLVTGSRFSLTRQWRSTDGVSKRPILGLQPHLRTDRNDLLQQAGITTESFSVSRPLQMTG